MIRPISWSCSVIVYFWLLCQFKLEGNGWDNWQDKQNQKRKKEQDKEEDDDSKDDEGRDWRDDEWEGPSEED